MSDPENPIQPLLNNQPTPNTGEPSQSGRSSRAWKVAFITLLACILIVGQGSIAYFLLNQSGDIKALEAQNNNMKMELRKGSSVSMPMGMHLPMDVMQMKLDDTVDDEASTGAPAHPQLTMCQLEAAGLIPMQVPGFRPSCDEHGFYMAKQCFQQRCWCVNPLDGKDILGTLSGTDIQCGSVNMNKLIPDVMA